MGSLGGKTSVPRPLWELVGRPLAICLGPLGSQQAPLGLPGASLGLQKCCLTLTWGATGPLGSNWGLLLLPRALLKHTLALQGSL